MSNLRHESVVLLLSSSPKLVAELCLEVLGMRLPRFARIELDDATVGQLTLPPLRGDLAYRLVDKEGTPVHALVVEAQRGADKDKLFSWPHYVTSGWVRLRCPTELVVVAFEPGGVRLAKQPIRFGLRGEITPWLIHRHMIPIIVDPAEAYRRPDWGLLSVLAHIDDKRHAPAVFRAAIEGLLRRTDSDSKKFLHLVLVLLRDEASTEVRNMVK
jgi:hypothetical protein